MWTELMIWVTTRRDLIPDDVETAILLGIAVIAGIGVALINRKNKNVL